MIYSGSYFLWRAIHEKMGGKTSKSASSSITSAIQSIVTKSATNCSSKIDAHVGIDISGDGNTVEDSDLSQTVELTTQCFSDSATRDSMTNDITTALITAIDQKNKGILSGVAGGRVEAMSSIYTEVSNVMNSEDTLSCINDIIASNVINISGSNNTVRRTKSAQAIKQVSECIMKRMQEMQTISTVLNQADTTASNENDMGLDLFGGLGGAVSAMVIGGLLFVIFIIYVIVKLVSWVAS